MGASDITRRDCRNRGQQAGLPVERWQRLPTSTIAIKEIGCRTESSFRGGTYRGAYVRRGVGAAAVGAAAVGARTAPYYYNGTCGYYPNRPAIKQ
jgi:hypothetical protein